MRRSPKTYVPPISSMAYSGVHASELKDMIRWLKDGGARKITVSEDNGEYDEAGPWYVIQYER